jgi:hypothetical protein
MTGPTQLSQYGKYRFARFGVVVSCAAVLLAGGCAERHAKVKQFPWSTYAYTRPVGLTLAPNSIEEVDPPEDVTLDVPPPPSSLVIARLNPARPRVPAGNPSQGEVASKPDVPQIAPQLTPAEASSAQQQTGASLSVAERNIVSAEGKTLNATQQDLASKIRSFMAEAREAANSGDWTRAKNAAKKAEVLSQELAGSL